MAIPPVIALLPGYTELKSIDLSHYTELHTFLADGPAWRQNHWNWAVDFLKYVGRNKSEHTYTRFRNEVERFLLWAFLISEKPIDEYKKSDILDYADFCWSPPTEWISTANQEHFRYDNGYSKTNEAWRPFRLKQPKKAALETPDKSRYRPSQQTLTATFTAVIAFYKHLMNEEFCYGNPAQIAKKDCRHFITDAQIHEVRRFSEEQWLFVLNTAEKMAEEDATFERSLFVIAALKTLFLRVSELSERKDWSPVMSHFWQDEDDHWWLKVYGKGRKLRDVSVPTDFMPYLKRYRSYRALPALPYTGDYAPIVEKLRGQGGMSSRHLGRLVQEVFDRAYDFMRLKAGEDKARKLREASTHWLRHTGASMEIERGRALKDLSEDLGHASMATTDTVYVQTEKRKRAQSGKGRKVN